MITKIKNGWIYTKIHGLSSNHNYRIHDVSIDDLLIERRKLAIKYLEFTPNTPKKIIEKHRKLDDQLARLIDSKCKEGRNHKSYKNVL